ncbi:hypothetical protein PTSG_07497 [Salpingoeca rosetta]|uniref:Tyrosine-protein kinase ephrin type A/B receptor-like domain-containing protein n=1 Tax=Salpingoeca rosetta (strain ATCC 50818 / BSB-021) TaxID=946362 RepID=F2UIW5_SALR5|nr:uncharacterized protein PTSG_07497 [Salpingoeca rosetta]EGD77164.1 hypothetical protein PTSG_07497 [Salpingoeca rosetta]|eukprot:XP_004991003.1 hypothetical protein PTSG_07497 [Salpingoeca rosetta]
MIALPLRVLVVVIVWAVVAGTADGNFVGQLTVTVLNATLSQARDTHVDLRLEEGTIDRTESTAVVFASSEPVWNETFVFANAAFELLEISLQTASSTLLKFTVTDFQTNGNLQFFNTAHRIHVYIEFTPDPQEYNCVDVAQLFPTCKHTCDGPVRNTYTMCWSDFYQDHVKIDDCAGVDRACVWSSGTSQTCPDADFVPTDCGCSDLFLKNTTCVTFTDCVSAGDHYAIDRVHHNLCVPISECGPHEYEFSPPSTSVDRTCTSCPEECEACIDKEQCTSCIASHALHDGICTPECPYRYFKNAEGICQQCGSNCETCEITADTCLTCIQGGAPPSCTSECDIGQFDSGSTCSDCDDPCHTCFGDDQVCTSCSGADLLTVSMSECGSSCPIVGSFSRDSIEQQPNINICYPCRSGCGTCDRRGVQCTSCQGADKLRDNGKCTDTCPPGHLVTGSSSFECRKCANGFISTSGSSCSPCGLGEYQKDVGASSCDMCPPGTFRADPAGHALASCTPCEPGTFSGGHTSMCITCHDGAIAPTYGTPSCIPCPENTYSLEDKTRCFPCPPRTFSYRGQFKCTDCAEICEYGCTEYAENCIPAPPTPMATVALGTTTTTVTATTTTPMPAITTTVGEVTSTSEQTTVQDGTSTSDPGSLPPSASPSPPQPLTTTTTTTTTMTTLSPSSAASSSSPGAPATTTTTTASSTSSSSALAGGSRNSSSSSGTIPIIAGAAAGAVLVAALVVVLIVRRRRQTRVHSKVGRAGKVLLESTNGADGGGDGDGSSVPPAVLLSGLKRNPVYSAATSTDEATAAHTWDASTYDVVDRRDGTAPQAQHSWSNTAYDVGGSGESAYDVVQSTVGGDSSSGPQPEHAWNAAAYDVGEGERGSGSQYVYAAPANVDV